MKTEIKIVNVTPDNVSEYGVCCIKDEKADGYKKKVAWFKNKLNQGLNIKIAYDENDKQLGFIESIPSELAWRPINAKNYLFIQCIAIFSKAARNKDLGTSLIKACEEDAKKIGKDGVCSMSSKGPWIANKKIFEKSDYSIADKKGRFELMYKSFDPSRTLPVFNDWTSNLDDYSGWNLLYADQCPWHEKSVIDLVDAARDSGVELNVIKIDSPKEAQNGPSGFGTFGLIKDGKLLEDHYLSKTRFKTILSKEMSK